MGQMSKAERDKKFGDVEHGLVEAICCLKVTGNAAAVIEQLEGEVIPSLRDVARSQAVTPESIEEVVEILNRVDRHLRTSTGRTPRSASSGGCAATSARRSSSCIRNGRW